jgi:hypothetical protein
MAHQALTDPAMDGIRAAQADRRVKFQDDLLNLTTALAGSRAGHFEAYFALDWIARDKHGTADELRKMARRWADDAYAALHNKVAS